SKNVRIGLLIATGIALILSLFLKAYWIRNEAWGYLFWNTEDVYIFVGTRDDGFRPTYLGLVGQEIEAMFPFGAPTPDEKHFSVLVLHVTRGSVQRYTMDNVWLDGPYPFHGNLYAGNMLTEKHLRWFYDHFEPASEEETVNLGAALRGEIPPGPSYDHVEGWSKRTIGGDFVYKTLNHRTISIEKDFSLTIKVAGQNLTFIMNSGFVTRHGYIDLIRPGQPPNRIWHWNEEPHFVRRAEYYRLFDDQIAREVVQHISLQP
ncbi:MAG: hypothetical protein WBG29_00660, partial [Candidatus Acidiferrales bacterium]